MGCLSMSLAAQSNQKGSLEMLFCALDFTVDLGRKYIRDNGDD